MVIVVVFGSNGHKEVISLDFLSFSLVNGDEKNVGVDDSEGVDGDHQDPTKLSIATMNGGHGPRFGCH